MKYRVHKIEQNYNQIWHEIKANKNIVVNYNFTYLLTKEHYYKYYPLDTHEECLVTKYHTHILHKQNLDIHYIL